MGEGARSIFNKHAETEIVVLVMSTDVHTKKYYFFNKVFRESLKQNEHNI